MVLQPTLRAASAKPPMPLNRSRCFTRNELHDRAGEHRDTRECCALRAVPRDAVEAIGNANGIGDFPHGYFSKEGETDEDNFLKEPFGNISLLGTGRRAWAAAFVRLIADNFRHKARPAMTD
jgi:hypothetical protein